MQQILTHNTNHYTQIKVVQIYYFTKQSLLTFCSTQNKQWTTIIKSYRQNNFNHRVFMLKIQNYIVGWCACLFVYTCVLLLLQCAWTKMTQEKKTMHLK